MCAHVQVVAQLTRKERPKSTFLEKKIPHFAEGNSVKKSKNVDFSL